MYKMAFTVAVYYSQKYIQFRYIQKFYAKYLQFRYVQNKYIIFTICIHAESYRIVQVICAKYIHNIYSSYFTQIPKEYYE